MNKDRYPELGQKVSVDSIEAALERVRQTWPNATMEGSTGAERSFWTKTSSGNGLIGHCWPKKFREEPMFLRCLPAGAEPLMD